VNKQEFISISAQRHSVGEPQVQQLESLLKSFPWFQAGQMVYAYQLKQRSSAFYPAQLKRTAASAPDRAWLKEFLENLPKSQFTEEKEPEILPEEIIVEETTVTTSISEQIPDIQEDAPPMEEVVTDSGSPEENLEEIAETETAETITEEDSPANQPSIEESDREENEPEESDDPLMDMLEKEIMISAAQASLLIHDRSERRKESKQDKKETTESQQEPEEADENSTLTFHDWLRKVSRERSSGIAIDEEAKKAKREKEQHLIEEFIARTPDKIKPAAKTEFYSPVNMAKQSLTEKEDIVTETLAKIYLRQGNYNKAIRIYESLSLRIPEKSVFFAAQIEKIKKEQKNRQQR
jgi:hypothetical protein